MAQFVSNTNVIRGGIYIRAVARVRAEMRILAEDEDKRRNFAPRFGLLPARRYASAGARHGPCVWLCPSPSQVGFLSKRLNESSWFLAWKFPSTYRTLRVKEIQIAYLQK